jgi:SAM-dependent methyltransferase
MDSQMELLCLERSNIPACQRLFGDDTTRYTPWNWASAVVSSYIPENGYVLDLMSGYGNPYITDSAINRHCVLELVDILPYPQDTLPSSISYTKCDLNINDPSFSEPFDCIVSVSSLEHVPEDARFRLLKWIKQALKPGGIVALTIGHLLGINDPVKVQNAFFEHPYFVKRGYPTYPSLNMKDIFDVLGIDPANLPEQAETFPGMSDYKDNIWCRDASICKVNFSNYSELAATDYLANVSAVEILMVIQKRIKGH